VAHPDLWALAARIGSESGVALVVAARVVPGFFLATMAGVIVDRMNRKHVMMFCDMGRAAVLCTLPFVNSVGQLVVASFMLELLTLLWQPAKEATVPNLVPREHLTTANSLNVAAAYGTFPIGAALFSLLARAGEWFGEDGVAGTLHLNQEGLAFYADAVTFLLAAFIVSLIAIPTRTKEERRAAGHDSWDLGATFRDIREGWHYIFITPRVRAVNVGLATGLIGGGMLIPLGPVFIEDVLGNDSGSTGDFGALMFMLGLGVGLAVIILPMVQNKVRKAKVFVAALFAAGFAIIGAASMWSLGAAAFMVLLLGLCAGTVYVLGFTLIQESVDDDLRGRIFSALLTLVRLCVLLALLLGPVLNSLFNTFSDEVLHGSIDVFGWTISLPGVRLTLWLAGSVILLAGVLAHLSLKGGPDRPTTLADVDGPTAPDHEDHTPAVIEALTQHHDGADVEAST
jgi:dTMP kinase